MAEGLIPRQVRGSDGSVLIRSRCLCSVCRRVLLRSWAISRSDRHERLESLRTCRAICGLSEIYSPGGNSIPREERPAASRPGPFGYVWDLECVARKNFELGPKTGRELGEFAKRAISHQPWECARAGLIDFLRFIDPAIAPTRAYEGGSRDILSFGWRDIVAEAHMVELISRSYNGTHVHLRWQNFLAFYQNLARPSGLSLAALVVLTLIGLVKAEGTIRLGIGLFGLSAFGLYLVPVVTLSYSFRCGIPAETLIIPPGVLAAVSFWPKFIEREQSTCPLTKTGGA
jgi:hypothetical protein